ncbi:MAG: tetratricopeptide repeat protein [Chloroflexi bacterium]|nr:tetratricopeptide repeat protein [Chloroflexota bacterium]
MFKTEDKARLRRQLTELAISLAMQSRWEEAITANRTILEVFPADVDAYNRQGKAFTEMGRFKEAREAYSRAMEIDPTNTIARKNLSRLAYLRDSAMAVKEERTRVDPHLFIEETGKTGVTILHNLGRKETLAKMTAGEPVFLRVEGKSLLVEDSQGEYLGQVEPKLALRLIKLIEGGNQYAAALTSFGEDNWKIIIKETYQHPSQMGRLSFPSRGHDGFRSYIKDSVLKYEVEEEHDEESEEWEEAEPTLEESGFYEETPGSPATVNELEEEEEE